MARKSPLKLVNPYGGNYADLSARVGRSAQGAIDELREVEDRKAEKERAAKQEERQKLQDQMITQKWAQQNAEQQASLYVSGESGVKSVDDAIFNASHTLADKSAELTSALRQGKRINTETGEEEEYKSDQYSSDYAKILGQVQSLKNFKSTVEPMATQFNEMIATGNVSKAMDPEAISFWNDLTSPGSKINLGTLEDNITMGIVGVTRDGNNVQIPLDQLNKMPQPMAAAPAPGAILAPALGELNKLKRWDDKTGKAYAAEALDGYLNTAGPNGLKALAMDQFDFDAEQMEQDFGKPGDKGYVNKLEEEMERRLTLRAKDLFIKDQVTAYQKETLALKKQQLKNQALKDGNTTDFERQIKQLESKANVDRMNYNDAINSFTGEDENGNPIAQKGTYAPLYGTEIHGKEIRYAGLGKDSPFSMGRNLKDKHVLYHGKNDVAIFNSQDELNTYIKNAMNLQYQQQLPPAQAQAQTQTEPPPAVGGDYRQYLNKG